MRACFIVSVLLCAFIACHAKPDGAPKGACATLTPSHSGIEAQKNRPPYNVAAVQSGNKVKVTVTSPIGEEFQGFVLQARSANDRTKFIDGEFTEGQDTKATDCFKGKKNTLTQASPDAKKEVVTEWTPKGSVNEDVVFRATVAKTYGLFWTEIDSSPVKIGTGDVPSPTEAGKSSNDEKYAGCFVSKGCFGLPAECAQRKDCEVLLTYARIPTGIQFEMQGYLDSSSYMAVALSKDGFMGEDSVTECVREGDGVSVRESWNEGKGNTRTRELSKDQYSSSFANGLSKCTWQKPLQFESDGQSYDLANETCYVLLAEGKVTSGKLQYHDERLPSDGAVNFTAFEMIASKGVTDSVKVHGCFMVTAWVGFVSFAILLARHFKNAWEDSTLGGVKIWFALHRAFMIAGLSFVSVAFIVIFVHKNGWNYSTSNPHAILGCIATGLGLLNPIMACFRPGPDHPKRPIFNWLHWAVGNSAQIVAVITIFYAVQFRSSGLDLRFYWVMAVFAVVHVIVHLLYQVHSWTQAKKKTNELSLNEMNGARSYNVQEEQNNARTNTIPDSNFRLFLLNIYAMFVLAVLITLYVLIGTA